ncbi:pseudouridine synthase, partial [Gammaproteobacteria bacterium]|nr:pseudouridine synthase [Gammaproteobacteria bacterium]
KAKTNTAGGERLQKRLAAHGWGSRRQIEALIEAGEVRIDGRVAVLGDRLRGGENVEMQGQRWSVPRGETVDTPDDAALLIYNKPAGQICTRDDPQGRPTVFEHLPRCKSGRWVMIGRLDINTEGLLLFTNSGELANRLMHPRYGLKRHYRCRVFGDIDASCERKLRDGVALRDGPARFDSLRREEGSSGSRNQWYRVSIGEGRNREVRRLWQAVGARVSRLIRVAYGPISLDPKLAPGRYRHASDGERRAVLTGSQPQSH